MLDFKIGIDHFFLSKLVSLNTQFIYPVWLLLLQNMFVILSIVNLTIKLLPQVCILFIENIFH